MDASFLPDAPRALGEARERKLHAMRERFVYVRQDQPNEEDPAEVAGAVAWVERLALTGHVSAGRLLEKIGQSARAAYSLHVADPAMLQRITRDPAWTRMLVALGAVDARGTTAHSLEARMRRGSAALQELAQQLHELTAAGATLHWRDREPLRSCIWECHALDNRNSDLLVRLAEWRVASEDPRERGHGEAMTLRATQMHLPGAWDLRWKVEMQLEARLLGVETLQPAQGLEVVKRWFAAGRPAVPETRRACFAMGVACEAGRAGQAQDTAQALAWYERAFMGAIRLEEDGTPGQAFCNEVLRWLQAAQPADSPLLRELVAAWQARASDAAGTGGQVRG